MAYANWSNQFPKIRSAMGVSDEQTPNQSIFGDQSVQSDPAKDGIGNAPTAPQAQTGGTPGAQQKTSIESDVSGGGGQDSGGNEAVPAVQQQRSSGSNVIRKNIGKTSSPSAIGRAQGSVEQANQALQDEANSYTANYKATNTSLKNEDLDRAIAGDDEAKSAAATRLAKSAADRAASFQPKTDYEVDDISQLQTDAGVKGLLRRDAGEQYNAGEGAFDMQLLRRDPEFNRVRSNLMTRQNEVTSAADRLRFGEGVGEARTKSLTEQGQEYLDKEFADSTKSAKDYLDTKDDEILGRLKSQAEAENSARAALRQTADQTFLDAEKKAVFDKVIADARRSNSEYGKFVESWLAKSGINAKDFYGVGGDLAYSDLATEAEANPFNRIMELLGRGETMVAGKGAGSRQNVNRQAFQSALMKAAEPAYAKYRADQEAAAAKAAAIAEEKKAREEAGSAFGGAYDADGAKFPEPSDGTANDQSWQNELIKQDQDNRKAAEEKIKAIGKGKNKISIKKPFGS